MDILPVSLSRTLQSAVQDFKHFLFFQPPPHVVNPFHLFALKAHERDSRKNWADIDEIETHPVIAATVILSGRLPYA